ncbi:MAG: HEAT repeat domain-containing protein [Verrucomicrobia bacterium]|nr:MAG: HEAT repeat domain-containing protein [Verrucomicrobiota bacterium]
MSEVQIVPRRKRNLLRWIAGALAIIGMGLVALTFWFAGVSVGNDDPLFHGKPESEWIKSLKYSDDQQVKEWRSYGEEGVQVLIRGLEHANHPGERAYRQFYRRTPAFLMRWLPAPKQDSTRAKRMELVSLLSSLGNDATNATAIMIRTLTHDEDASVRQSTINFFTGSEDEKCLLNQLPAREKRKLVPALIRGLQDTGNWGLRNNAANALKWIPEEKIVVAPALVTALQDPQPQVRLLAAQALNRVDPDTAKKVGAVSVILAVAKNPDDQVAARAISGLRNFKNEPDAVVPVLIELLESTNTLVGCEAVWILEWSGREFRSYSNSVVPALAKAAERKDNVGRYAKVALKRFQSGGDPTKAIK